MLDVRQPLGDEIDLLGFHGMSENHNYSVGTVTPDVIPDPFSALRIDSGFCRNDMAASAGL
jgi:hypothetical protein